MAEFALAGDELKRMVLAAKKQPLPFAYCPGPGTPEDLFALHRKKPGEIMAKELRSSGEGGKVGYGTALVDGKLMQLACDKHLPNMAKRLKKFLKLNKISLNVEVLDQDGNVIDADIEDLEDNLEDPAEDAPAGSEDQDGAQDPSPQSEQKPDDAAVRALTERFKAVQAFVMAATGGNAEQLRKVMAAGVGSLKAGDLVNAEKAVAAIEKLRSRDAEAPAKPGADDGAMRDLAARLQALAPRVSAAPPAMTDKLKATLTAAVGALRTGDTGRAEQLVAALEKALDAIAAMDSGAAVARKAVIAAQGDVAASLGELSRRLNDLGDPEASSIAKIVDTVAARVGTPPAGRPEAEALIDYISKEKAVEAVEQSNQFGVAIDIRARLTPLLGKLLETI